MNWFAKISQALPDRDYMVHLECLCADDFGAKNKNELTDEDIEHIQNYDDTRHAHKVLESLARKHGIECNILDTDDRDSKHSDAYLYFWWSRVETIIKMLEQVSITGDILDVPNNFPAEFEEQAKTYGWIVERGNL